MKSMHEKYMNRCFDLANLAGKATGKNPKVGAVLVYDNKIIGEGFHRIFGGPHAEVEAINSVNPKDKHLIPHSTLYVSLEPCAHQGKTPACTERIIMEGIQNVVIGCKDPNSLVAGQGMEKLRKSGINLVYPVLEKSAKELIRPFVQNLIGRPYIILKWAKSKDNYIGQLDKQIWLTAPATSVLTHKWRSEVDGILVGKNTVNVDNPVLNTRAFPGDDPLRVVLDTHLNLGPDKNLISDSLPTLIVNTLKNKKTNNKVCLKVDEMNDDLIPVIKRLFLQGINTLIVEGGSKVLQSFIKQNIWNEARIICTPQKLHFGIPSPNIEGLLLKKIKIDRDEIVYILNKNQNV